MKVLAKYDIRGIQKYIFRTKKLKEIRAVQNIPERIIFESLKEAAEKKLDIHLTGSLSESDCVSRMKEKGIHILDKAGGNTYILFEHDDAVDIYKTISKEMAFYILEKTYSLELVYAYVECTENFFNDYEKLNFRLGKLKSQMPSASHIGAFSICRRDPNTLFPIIGKDKFGSDITMESYLKNQFHASLSSNKNENILDNYILEKGVDSHIAIIHIDGNNMGNRINKILEKATYENADKVFASIRVRDRFADVCQEMNDLTEQYIQSLLAKDSSKKREDIHLIHAVIQAGDDITYITRADIALSFTKKFIQLVSKKYMIDNTEKPEYLISACAGIAYIDSHFPFSDGYDLAEACCANAKKRAKKLKCNDGYIGNWIDYEICRHIKDTDLTQSRKSYSIVGSTVLVKKPYCISHSLYHNDFFDFDSFENKIRSLKGKTPIINRSRAKDFREAYTKGPEYVETLKNAAVSRGYFNTEDEIRLYEDYPSGDGTALTTYASYYDPIEIMDLYSDFN